MRDLKKHRRELGRLLKGLIYKAKKVFFLMDCHSRKSNWFYGIAILFYAIHILAHLIPALFVFAGLSPGFEEVFHEIAEGPIGILLGLMILPVIIWDFYIHKKHHAEIHQKEHRISELEKRLGIKKKAEPDCTHEELHRH